MAFYAIQNYLDRDAESYKETCARNAINGQKGGKVTQEKARQAKQADNDIVNNIVTEKEKEKEQIINIIEKMPYTTSETHEMFDTEPEDYTLLIDKYFETPFNNCDYRINHFFSGDIRTNRFYEELY